ncbi:oxidoreductase, partial [candidate division KSB1 bacterium]|nr:oxidoreductase [candidate division KSB1 bacterium]
MRRSVWLRIALYGAIVLSPLALSLVLGAGRQKGVALETGKSFALVAFAILVMQFVLAARLKWIERPFGLDSIFRFHKAMAILAVTLLIMHPLLLSVGTPGWFLLTSLDVPWYIWAGRVGLLVLLVQGVTSGFRGFLKIEFETWRLMHDILAPLILVIVFVHSWNAGSDLKAGAMKMLWVIFFGGSILTYVYHRGVRKLLLRRNGFRVKEVRQESHDVWTLRFEPEQGSERYDHLPGQFHFVTLYRRGDLPAEEHPFTIASSPTQPFLESTIKQSGDFTGRIPETIEDDRATLHGPFGRFSYVLHPEQRQIVFIAGGIGVTPLMSMLRHMRDTQAGTDVLLIYANRTE